MPPVNPFPVPGYMRWLMTMTMQANVLGYTPSAGGSRQAQGSDIAPSGAGAHSFHADTLA